MTRAPGVIDKNSRSKQTAGSKVREGCGDTAFKRSVEIVLRVDSLLKL